VPTEDVVNVLRNVHRSLAPGGLALDIHPIGCDLAVWAGVRGLGFVDSSRFLPIVRAMDRRVASVIREGLFDDVLGLERRVALRFDTPTEALERAAEWENLRLPPAVRRRLRLAEGPVHIVDTIRYRLLRKRSRRR
jgi:hypothetical protein